MTQHPHISNEAQTIAWLLKGDVSIQYQVHRDLHASVRTELRDRISTEGWGARLLGLRRDDGHWGQGYYRPKWTSTHYTILDLKNMGISPDNEQIRETISLSLRDHRGPDGGIYPIGAVQRCDVCLNGMFLNFACYFKTAESQLTSIVDFVLGEHMADGGFNCKSNRGGAVHSSLHSTLSILEGFLEYRLNGYTYRLSELPRIEHQAIEFVLQHRLFRSDRTGEIIDKKMLLLSYPSRWHYDILRALDYFQLAGVTYDPRMKDGMDVLMKKRRKDGRWPVQGKHPGQVHFDMEKPGKPSRWNTLRVLRVLKHFGMATMPAARR